MLNVPVFDPSRFPPGAPPQPLPPQGLPQTFSFSNPEITANRLTTRRYVPWYTAHRKLTDDKNFGVA
jgi:hypothetical protein